jgi:hypothetical protein
VADAGSDLDLSFTGGNWNLLQTESVMSNDVFYQLLGIVLQETLVVTGILFGLYFLVTSALRSATGRAEPVLIRPVSLIPIPPVGSKKSSGMMSVGS